MHHFGRTMGGEAKEVEARVLERVARRSDNIAMVGNIPYLVLELVSECIGQEMDNMEALMDVPRRIYHQDVVQERLERSGQTWVCRSDARRALRALTGVHSEATKLAWSVLRRRLFLTNPSSKKLAERPSWLRSASVRELWMHFEEAEESGYGPEELDAILNWVSSQLPNLRVLSLEQDHSAACSKLMTALVKAAPSLTITALQIRITSWNGSTLLCLYDSISLMPNLTTLSVCGALTSDEHAVIRMESHRLASIYPPSSLKSLMITLQGEGTDSLPVVELLTWLLQSRGHYSLEDLMLRYQTVDWLTVTLASHIRVFACLLSTTLPRLRVFDIDLLRAPRPVSRSIGQFVTACSSLEELQVTRIPVYPLPMSLQVLRINMSVCLYHGRTGYSDEELANYLHGILSSGKVPHLRRVYVTAYEYRTRRTYPRSLEICQSFGIALLSIEQDVTPI